MRRTWPKAESDDLRPNARFDFHWTSAALIAALWVVGQTADWFPRGPLRGAAWSTHFTLGRILRRTLARPHRLALYLGTATAGPRLAGAGDARQGRARAALSGDRRSSARSASPTSTRMGRASGDSSTSPRSPTRTLRGLISESHEWGANLLLLLAAGHAVVALVHQFVMRDGALARMWPPLSRRLRLS